MIDDWDAPFERLYEFGNYQSVGMLADEIFIEWHPSLPDFDDPDAVEAWLAEP